MAKKRAEWPGPPVEGQVEVFPDLTFPLRRSVEMVQEDPKAAKEAFRAAAAASAPERPPQCPNCGVRHRSLTTEQCTDRQMSERTLQDRVMDRARRRGWKVAHAGKGWTGTEGVIVTPMAPGWPDLTLAKAGHRLIFMELKAERGEVSEDQWFWLRLLNECGARAIVVRPSDLREGRVNAVLNQGSPL